MHRIKQMLEFLPEKIKNALQYVNSKFVYEIRLRADKPTLVNFFGKYCFLGEYGLCDNTDKAIKVSRTDIEKAVHYAGNFSMYCIEEQIKRGFITAEGGVRIGLAGEYVYENSSVLTIRNITSLCIRIPHEIIGAGKEIFQRCMSDKIVNLLVASLPGRGKTTILRDLARIVSEKHKINVLICDERGEISAKHAGDTCDVLLYADKATAFEAGVRALSPDLIITDELAERDLFGVEKLVCSGIKVVASLHANSMQKVPEKYRLAFDKIVFLQDEKIGEIACVYEKNGTDWRLIFDAKKEGEA